MIVAPPTAPTRWKEAPNKRKQLHCTKDSFPPAGPTPPLPSKWAPANHTSQKTRPQEPLPPIPINPKEALNRRILPLSARKSASTSWNEKFVKKYIPT